SACQASGLVRGPSRARCRSQGQAGATSLGARTRSWACAQERASGDRRSRALGWRAETAPGAHAELPSRFRLTASLSYMTASLSDDVAEGFKQPAHGAREG